MTTEKWKPVEGFKSYEVSDLGRVRRAVPDSLGRPCRVLKPNILSKGYLQVGLYRDGKVHPLLVHVLVAKAFVPNPLNLPQVNHLGENGDCKALQLEWCTEQGNMLHAVQTGRKRGDGVSFTKRTKKWRAEFFPKPNQRVYLGEFNTKEEALRVRNEAVKGIQHTV